MSLSAPMVDFQDEEEDVEIVMNDYDQEENNLGYDFLIFLSRFQKPLSVATGISAAGCATATSSSAICPTCGGTGGSNAISNSDTMPALAPAEILSGQLTAVLSDGLSSAPMASSIYNIELDSIEDKPWRQPGSDLTDYFNYGFDEQTWRLYCLRQKSQREEAHQSRRIGIFESGSGGSQSVPASSITSSPPPAEYYFTEESKSHASTRSHRSRSRSRSRSRGESRKTDRRPESRRSSDHESKDRPDYRPSEKTSSTSSYSRSISSRASSSSAPSSSSRKTSSSYRN